MRDAEVGLEVGDGPVVPHRTRTARTIVADPGQCRLLVAVPPSLCHLPGSASIVSAIPIRLRVGKNTAHCVITSLQVRRFGAQEPERLVTLG